MKGDRKAGDVALGLLGIAMFLALWQIIGVYRLAGLTWPPLTDVIDTLTDPNRTGVFLRGARSTFSSAAVGFTLGSVLGLAVATGVHLAPPLRLGVDRLASVVNALPGIALGPILIVTLGPAAAPVALATISVFFLTYAKHPLLTLDKAFMTGPMADGAKASGRANLPDIDKITDFSVAEEAH